MLHGSLAKVTGLKAPLGHMSAYLHLKRFCEQEQRALNRMFCERIQRNLFGIQSREAG